MNHKELDVWKSSMQLVLEIYELTNTFPRAEMFGLTNQLRRCSVSIPSNIAEGAGRETNKEYKRFLVYARGSATECETQLIIANSLGYLSDSVAEATLEQLNRILMMLNGLIRRLN